jgi:hypothetical protein
MGAIADAAQVSIKTVEALYGTKPALLAAAVDYAIRGDPGQTPVIARQSARNVESAPDAATMLERHAEHIVAINERSARIARVVESAAGADPRVAELWQRMGHNRRFGARWAANTLLAKPGVRPDIEFEETTHSFVIALDWGTYRTLTDELGLDRQHAKTWLLHYYQRMFLAPP